MIITIEVYASCPAAFQHLVEWGVIESLNAGVCDKRYHYRNKIKELPLIVLIDTSNFSALSE